MATSPSATDSSDRIDGLPVDFPFPKSWMINKLKIAFKVDYPPLSISAKRLDEGAGYLSLIAAIRLTWPSEGSSLPQKVVVKVPTAAKLTVEFNRMESDMDKEFFDDVMARTVRHVHNQECLAYSIIAEGEPKLLTPHSFYFEQDSEENPGLLMMEDLSDKAGLVDFIEGLSMTQVHQLIDQLAKLQAFSILNRAKWDGKLGMFGERDMMKEMPQMFAATCNVMRDDYGDMFAYTDDEVMALCDEDRWWNLSNPSKDDTYLVFVHGDMWSNNFLFKRSGNFDAKGKAIASEDLLAVLDWQCVHPGSCGEDLVRLLSSSVSPEMRREHEIDFIKRLYDKMCEELERHGGPETKKPPFCLDYMKKMYYKNFPVGTAFMLMQFPMMAKGYLAEETDERKRKVAWRVTAMVQDAVKHREAGEC